MSANCFWAAVKTSLTILLVSVLSGCGGSGNGTSTTTPAPGFLYAATQNGITAFPFDSSTGALGTGFQASSVFTATDPLANMVPDPSGKFLFAGSHGDSSTEAFSIDAKTGVLTPISGSTLPLQGFPGCTLSMDPTGKFLYIATSAGVSAFTLNSASGVLSSVAGSPFSDGSVLRESAIDPSGKFLYAISNNPTSNTISVFTINSSSGALTPIAGSPFQMAINGFAYSVVVHSSGKFLYVSFPQSEEIAAWSINASTGAITVVPGSPFPSGRTSGDAPNSLLVTPSGAFLYALSGGTTVFGYSVDANSGALSPINDSPFTLSPATDYIAIDPSGRFAYAAYENANTVGGFNINASTGALTAFTAPPKPAAGVSLLTVVKSSQ
ncbi:MAG TPA: beta-propeller fold lactonase family protein [Candidatus Acidoferrales bacterium]|nr:beta-propeller fold lactonase family protein [Candidatus Acidoferrales bacterium]